MDGIKDRERVLNHVLNVVEWKAEDVLKKACSKYPKRQVRDHDVLDALVAAVTAYRGYGQFRTLPSNSPRDEFKKDLSMEMVYWIPQEA